MSQPRLARSATSPPVVELPRRPSILQEQPSADASFASPEESSPPSVAGSLARPEPGGLTTSEEPPIEAAAPPAAAPPPAPKGAPPAASAPPEPVAPPVPGSAFAPPVPGAPLCRLECRDSAEQRGRTAFLSWKFLSAPNEIRQVLRLGVGLSLLEPTFHLLRVDEAGLLHRDLAVLHHEEVWYSADSVAPG